MKLNVNKRTFEVRVTPNTPLLWVLRDYLNLTGTKFGCGRGICGACTVLVNGNPTRSCVFPVSSVGKLGVTTIEGLSPDSSHPIQKAWTELNVPQCGYCQSGQILTAAALLAANPKPTESDVDGAMMNICRCGTYNRIRRAVQKAAGEE